MVFLFTEVAVISSRLTFLPISEQEALERAETVKVTIPGQTVRPVDGGKESVIEYENFNAAGAHVEINGFNVHPGSAKDTMINALLVANEAVSMLPPAEAPAPEAPAEEPKE